MLQAEIVASTPGKRLRADPYIPLPSPAAADCTTPFVSWPSPDGQALGQAQIATAPFRRQSLDRLEIPTDAEARRVAGLSVAVADPHRLGRQVVQLGNVFQPA